MMLFSIKTKDDYDIDMSTYEDNLDPKVHRELGQYFSYFVDNERYEEENAGNC